MSVIYSGGKPIEITAGRGDLRFGSERTNWSALPAAPSWYGLHGGWMAPVKDGDALRLTPVSFAQIFATQPWVFAAVQKLMGLAIKVPLKVYRRLDDGEKERLMPGDHALADAVYKPWERGGQFNLVASLLGPLLVHGNGTVQVESGASDRIEFRPRDWRYLSALQVFQSTISGWESSEDGIDEIIPVQEMIHAAWWSPLGAVGVSPLHALGVTLEVEQAARQYARANLKNMARPASAVTVSNDFLGFDPETRKAAIDAVSSQVSTLYGGPENAGKVAILPTGLSWDAIGHTAHEAELIEQRRIDREEIAAVLNVPPPMIGILDHATYSNIDTLRDVAYTDSLGAPLALIESTLNSQLVRGLLGDDEIFVEFDFAGVLRGNRLQEVQAIREAIGTGLMTPNEGRSTLNLPPDDSDAADQLYLPTNNLTPLGTDPAASSERQLAESIRAIASEP